MKILVADDHDLVREMTANFIAAEDDATVEQAATLEEAVAAVKSKGPFDLVLLDYVMPGMNGIEGLEAMLGLRQGSLLHSFRGLCVSRRFSMRSTLVPPGSCRRPLE